MTLPSFLIIGAMKSGTTMLFADFATHPDVLDPLDKEPGDLKSDDVLSQNGRSDYERRFPSCRDGQLTFEASTHYSQAPQWTGVACRARNVLGSDLRILYIVREPVARVCSHHRHLVANGAADPDINIAVRANPLFIEFSRYFRQLEPWLDVFGASQIRVIRFESYIANRAAACGDVQAFLGLDPRPDLILQSSVANASQGKLLHTSLSRVVGESRIYRNLVRPLIPAPLKRAAKQGLMRRSRGVVSGPSTATIRAVLDATAEDVRRITPLIHPVLPVGQLAWDESAAMKLAQKPGPSA
jgi:hypothetical protein